MIWGGGSKEGRTLLHYLARDAEVEMMEVFRKANVGVIDVGKRDREGKPAMMVFRERRPGKELEVVFEALVGSMERGFWGQGEESEDEFVDARETLDEWFV